MLRPASLSDRVSSWLPGWPAVTPHPAADWELVFCGRTRCTGQKWWLREASLSLAVVKVISNGSGFRKGQLQRT